MKDNLIADEPAARFTVTIPCRRPTTPKSTPGGRLFTILPLQLKITLTPALTQPDQARDLRTKPPIKPLAPLKRPEIQVNPTKSNL